jgi:hypothetical protein
MYKIVSLLKRKPGLTMDEFIEHYENVHSKIGERFMGKWVTHYSRRYLRPIKHPLVNGTIHQSEADYDVIMELWFESREGFDEANSSFSPDDLALIIDDEERFLDRSKMSHLFTVEEHFSPPESLKS